MKVTFVQAGGNEYMTQYDHEHVLFTRTDATQRQKMVVIELAYGEVRDVRVCIPEQKREVKLKIDQGSKFSDNPHDIVRAYVPLVEQVKL